MEDFIKMMQEIEKRQNAMIQYDLAEGFIFVNKDGFLQHTTPEMLSVTEDIFIGIEDVVNEIMKDFMIQG